MILVDIYVPAVDREYDFSLDETAKIAGILEEVASMVGQKEQCELSGSADELLLCSMEERVILPKDKSLAECGIINGKRLLMV